MPKLIFGPFGPCLAALGHSRRGRPLAAVLGVLLMEFGDFAMMSRMPLGIKGRADSGIAGPTE